MPIRFRCGGCYKLLGIATRKAGSDTVCPHCGATITVPTTGDVQPDADPSAGDGDPLDLAEIDALLSEQVPPAQVSRPVAPPPRQPEHRPPAESNVDLVPNLNNRSVPRPQQVPPPIPPRERTISGHNPGQMSVSVQQVMGLVVLVVVMIFGAFVAGYLMGKRA
ncbi:MAG: hypothetical protein C0467_05765 [Planctomycetaceae bacterium]|nr:hypothetical protein [Planctomycetaceae bacterium]